MTKLFVGNLPSPHRDEVRALFEQHGTIESIAMINDRETDARVASFHRDVEQRCCQAISSLNGHQMDGRAIKVNEAQARSDAPRAVATRRRRRRRALVESGMPD